VVEKFGVEKGCGGLREGVAYWERCSSRGVSLMSALTNAFTTFATACHSGFIHHVSFFTFIMCHFSFIPCYIITHYLSCVIFNLLIITS
jgi:hypothetical protein